MFVLINLRTVLLSCGLAGLIRSLTGYTHLGIRGVGVGGCHGPTAILLPSRSIFAHKLVQVQSVYRSLPGGGCNVGVVEMLSWSHYL